MLAVLDVRRELLARARGDHVPPALEELPPAGRLARDPGEVEAWLRECGEQEAAPHASANSAQFVSAALAFAPFVALRAAWLGPLALVGRSHTALGCACQDALSFERHGGESGPAPASAFAAALGRSDVLTLAHLVHDARVTESDVAFALAPLRLLSPASSSVLLGFHLGFALGPPPPEVLASLGTSAPRWTCALAAGTRPLAAACLGAFAAEASPDWHGLARGISVYLHARERWRLSLAQREPTSPREAMVELVRRKAPFARGFHAHVRAAGRSLDAHFGEAERDPSAAVEALACSPHVVAGCPDASPLVRATAFGGPMFGVFTSEELVVVRAFITSLKEGDRLPNRGGPSAAPRATALPSAHVAAATRPSSKQGESLDARSREPRSSRLSGRVLYRLLLAEPSEPSLHGLALAHVRALASRAEADASPSALSKRGLWPPSPAALSAWARSTLDAQVMPHPSNLGAMVERAAAGALGRDDAAWMLLQLAPAAFVDGAWLEGAVRVPCPDGPLDEAAPLLHRIYRDELGAGVPAQHHGAVMHRTLSALGFALPEPGDPRLVERTDLADAAFELPALWLALGRVAPHVPFELLGLNLAVELSGVGQGYARAAALLRAHGIDPLFFELHNSIDNGESGHTAWSVEALVRALRRLEREADGHAVERAWRSVWTGYGMYGRASAPLVRLVTARLAWRVARRSGRALGSRLWARS